MAAPQHSCGSQPTIHTEWTESKADLTDISSKDFSCLCFSATGIVSSSLQNFSSFCFSFLHSPQFLFPVTSCSFCLLSLRYVTTFYPKYILISFNSTVLFSGHMNVYSEEIFFLVQVKWVRWKFESSQCSRPVCHYQCYNRLVWMHQWETCSQHLPKPNHDIFWLSSDSVMSRNWVALLGVDNTMPIRRASMSSSILSTSEDTDVESQKIPFSDPAALFHCTFPCTGTAQEGELSPKVCRYLCLLSH